jgi:hypothetical protein
MTQQTLVLSDLFSRVVLPPLFVFTLFVALLVFAGWAMGRRSTRRREPGPRTVKELLRSLLATAAGGYVFFLAVVAVFHVAIAGQPVSTLGNAASGGAFLAFVVAIPLYAAVVAVRSRRSRRWGS